MSSNTETGDYLRSFTEREENLRQRAAAVKFNLDCVPWNSWQQWFGDSANYLCALRNAVEEAEGKI